MFNYIGQVDHSYSDYKRLLKYNHLMIRDFDLRGLDLAMDGNDDLEFDP